MLKVSSLLFLLTKSDFLRWSFCRLRVQYCRSATFDALDRFGKRFWRWGRPRGEEPETPVRSRSPHHLISRPSVLPTARNDQFLCRRTRDSRWERRSSVCPSLYLKTMTRPFGFAVRECMLLSETYTLLFGLICFHAFISVLCGWNSYLHLQTFVD